ncbi:hypothetical protein A6R71_16640 [Xanthomonas translucens pv. arrhenatheri]|uniref:HNH endonuclease 5 domain-containing protein n=2 Tax=Xanthomonas translucens group TaxID=3390202 RepID=A0A0K2ZIV7_9XANT|nr:hypothetical protein A6R71_16640 [Xanthomonas translucens pv. arrhenatheri]CTP83300.1 hypothetical protein XTALMG727_0587 [Xanthomonas translucens pv. arrhenatheri LMG 727]
MITNEVCPYCLVIMVKAENLDNSRSVEHLIPNAALTRKRKNDEGDFYACRRCNSQKSKVDEVIGAMAKAQSADSELAASALIKLVTRHESLPARYARMLDSAQPDLDGVHVDMPLTGPELIQYLTFLGKGAYFKKFKKPLRSSNQIMLIDLHNKQILASFEQAYEAKHGTRPVRDLETNPRSEVIEPGQSVIWSKGTTFFIVLHDYLGISIKVRPRNRKNERRARTAANYLLQHFGH